MQEQIPKSLSHVLQVYRLVQESLLSRTNAIKDIAKKERTAQSTIASACTRDIAIKGMGELDYFLQPHKASEFRDHLIQRFPQYQTPIEEFFLAFQNGKDTLPADYPERTIRPLLPGERKNVLHKLLLIKVHGKLSAWVKRGDIPVDLKQEIQEMLDQIPEKIS